MYEDSVSLAHIQVMFWQIFPGMQGAETDKNSNPPPPPKKESEQPLFSVFLIAFVLQHFFIN